MQERPFIFGVRRKEKNKMKKKNFWGYSGRFVLTYIVVYSVIGFFFLNFQRMMPVSARVALDFFEPFRLNLVEIILQGIRAALIALVLYPFYNQITDDKKGMWAIFAALWGLSLLGSLEPKPGSIEGIIYTETSMVEHFIVMVTVAIQVLIFSKLFLRWEKSVIPVESRSKE